MGSPILGKRVLSDVLGALLISPHLKGCGGIVVVTPPSRWLARTATRCCLLRSSSASIANSGTRVAPGWLVIVAPVALDIRVHLALYVILRLVSMEGGVLMREGLFFWVMFLYLYHFVVASVSIYITLLWRRSLLCRVIPSFYHFVVASVSFCAGLFILFYHLVVASVSVVRGFIYYILFLFLSGERRL
jgi:hypothetical protein